MMMTQFQKIFILALINLLSLLTKYNLCTGASNLAPRKDEVSPWIIAFESAKN